MIGRNNCKLLIIVLLIGKCTKYAEKHSNMLYTGTCNKRQILSKNENTCNSFKVVYNADFS